MNIAIRHLITSLVICTFSLPVVAKEEDKTQKEKPPTPIKHAKNCECFFCAKGLKVAADQNSGDPEKSQDAADSTAKASAKTTTEATTKPPVTEAAKDGSITKPEMLEDPRKIDATKAAEQSGGQPTQSPAPAPAVRPIELAAESSREAKNVPSVAVKLEGNKILGIRIIAEAKQLRAGEIQAYALADGENMILGIDPKLLPEKAEFIVVEKLIDLDPETSKTLGSNIRSIIPSEYPIDERGKEAGAKPYHCGLVTKLTGGGNHKIWRSMIHRESDLATIQLCVASIPDAKLPNPVLVRIKDGQIIALKSLKAEEKDEIGGEVFKALPAIQGGKFVLTLDRPISDKPIAEMKTAGRFLFDPETSDVMGKCWGWGSQSAIVVGANSKSPIITLEPELARPSHNRRRTPRVIVKCPDWGKHGRIRSFFGNLNWP